MHSPRWRKVIRDLLKNKSRTLLVVLAIAVGVFAFGSVFITQDILLKNIETEYLTKNPSTITIFTSEFDTSLVNWVKSIPGVSDAEGMAGQTVKIVLRDGKEETISLNAFPDYSQKRLNLLVPQKGTWPPGKNEIVLERNSLKAKLYVGDMVKVKNKEDRVFNLYLSGSVYDNSAIPYIFTNQLTGFTTPSTLESLGYSGKFNKLNIATSPDIKTLDDAEKLTFELTENMKDRGMEIMGSQINKPNQHWATDNSKAFTAILSVIGVFSLVLSGFLVINTISALLSQQKKQIGIMKAIGASRSQISLLYLITVGFYGFLALFIAVPVGTLLGYYFLKLVTDFLNFDINVFYLPPRVFLMEVLAALLIPVVSAAIPIFQSSKNSVREAIYENPGTAKKSKIDLFLIRLSWLSLPFRISLRNVFRIKGRLMLTLGTLVTAGALFIGVINVRTSMYREMDRILSMFDFEVSLDLTEEQNISPVTSRLMEIPGVTAVEARNHAGGRRIKSDGTKGGSFGITGLLPETVFSHPVVLKGRWLVTEDKDKIVLSSGLARDNQDLSVGDIINTEVGTEKHNFEVIGVIAMTENLSFTDFSTLSRIKDEPNLATGFLIKTSPQDAVTQDKIAGLAEESLDRAGISTARKDTKSKIYASAANQFNFLIFFLLAMAFLVAVVGGLALTGTMSLNVLERTREIGIMRSIGAGDSIIRNLVVIEGIMVGLISWILALPLSALLTFGFCYMLGNAFFERTLVFSFIPEGTLIWLTIVTVIAVFASVVPASNASRMGIGETLSYE